MTVLEAFRKIAYLQTLLGDLYYPENERIDNAIKKLKKHVAIKTITRNINGDLVSNGIVHLEDNSPVAEWVEHGIILWEIHINKAIKEKDIFAY